MRTLNYCSLWALVLACAAAPHITSGQDPAFQPQVPFSSDPSDPMDFGDLPAALPDDGPVIREFPRALPAIESRRATTQPISPSQEATLDRLHRPILRQDLRIGGAASCATSNCHGGPRPGVTQLTARRGMEYQIWAESDPHAQSWRTICGDESIQIMQRLGIMDGDEVVDQEGFDNCLACHNSVKRYREPRTAHRSFAFNPDAGALGHSASCNCNRCKSHDIPADANTFLREGIGCSGCHGPGEQWVNNHFRYDWSPQGATSQGFVEAGDLYVRARMCASCHVGDKDRDMNHDIIAAGHPALRYELATFHAWQPKHWRDHEASDTTAYEAQLWLAGQIAAADASLSLLEARANHSLPISEWPELAAYDCASCHHALGLDNDRDPFEGDRRGTAIYSQWNDAGLRWLLNYRIETGEASDEDYRLVAVLDEVREQMERQPEPSAEQVADVASLARIALADWFDGAGGFRERYSFRSDRLGRVVASAAGKRDSFRTWESAVQFYLAAVAARASWPGGWQGELRNVSDQLRFGLRYPEMIDVSRMAKRDEQGPELNRVGAMQLGIELAGWLGPVQPQAAFDLADDEQVTEEMRDRLEQMIERINQRWEGKGVGSQSEADRDGEEDDDREVEPDRTLKTRQELLEELRQRQRDRQSDTDENGSSEDEASDPFQGDQFDDPFEDQ